MDQNTPPSVRARAADSVLLDGGRAVGLLRREAPLPRTITCQLKQLETRAKVVAAAHPEPHIFCVIEPVNKRVTNTFEMATRKWTHFDPPRDRAEFEPIVWGQRGSYRYRTITPSKGNGARAVLFKWVVPRFLIKLVPLFLDVWLVDLSDPILGLDFL